MNNSQKIILVNPNTPKYSEYLRAYMPYKSRTKASIPLGLLYIAAVLEKNGIDVEVIDNYLLRLSTEELVTEIRRRNPTIVGFSIMTFTYPEARRNMMRLKEEMPEILVIVGGPHATLYSKELINKPFIDIVVLGEGEYALLEIVRALNDKEEVNRQLFKDIKGAAFKDNRGTLFNEDREFIKDLDGLPFPARHLVNMDMYPREEQFYLPNVHPVDQIASSRGCPFACTFCSSKILWKKIYRYRSAQNVVNEIEYLIKKYGSKGIYFRDDNFTVNKNRVIELCREIKRRKLSFDWMVESRVDLISRNLLEEMVSAGCKSIWFGFESGSQRMLDYLKKGFSLSDTEKTVKLCKEFGLTIGGTFIMGLPNEAKKDIEKTFKFMKKLDLDRLRIQAYVGWPKCEIYDEIKRNKYYKFEWEKILFVETPNLSYEEILELEDSINRKFQLSRILKRFQKPKLSELSEGFKIFRSMNNKRERISLYLKDLMELFLK